MNLKILCEKIKLQKEMVDKIEEFLSSFDVTEITNDIDAFLNEETAYITYEKLHERFKDEKDNTAILVCYLLACLKVYDDYKLNGIKEEIFIDTMACFSRFIEECKEKTGVYDFDRAWWTHKQVSQVIYRIGELEYEFISKEKHISIHIPSDALLTKEKLEESFKLLFEFIKNHKKEYIGKQVKCDTWLLSIKLKELLSENSKILNFQNCFDIIKVDEMNDGCFVWVFKQNYHQNYKLLPENTSLQKKIKNIMINNGHLGSATGILKEKYYE